MELSGQVHVQLGNFECSDARSRYRRAGQSRASPPMPADIPGRNISYEGRSVGMIVETVEARRSAVHEDALERDFRVAPGISAASKALFALRNLRLKLQTSQFRQRCPLRTSLCCRSKLRAREFLSDLALISDSLRIDWRRGPIGCAHLGLDVLDLLQQS